MLYKPKFCCNCGEKVERAEWPILASRRLCELCASENSEYDYFLRATAIICLICGLFGIAAFVRGSGGFGGNAESGLSIERASATRAGLEPVAGKALQKSPELMESSRPQTP